MSIGIVMGIGLCALLMLLGLGFLTAEWEKDDAAIGHETDE